MDFFYKHDLPLTNKVCHLESTRRNTTVSLPVSTIGYIARKTEKVDTAFSSCNFSFILDGTGRYSTAGHDYEVTPPCVLTQFPGQPVCYGPHGSWTELFLIYPGAFYPRFKEMGMLETGRYFWRPGEGGHLTEMVAELLNLLEKLDLSYGVDLADQACSTLILNSFAGALPVPERNPDVQTLFEIEKHLRRHCLEPMNLDEIARRKGLHPAKFRRLWNRYHDTAPGQFVADLQLRQAGRLLVETPLRIKEIAFRTGFNDELYFSKRFKMSFGMSPSRYRAEKRDPYHPHI